MPTIIKFEEIEACQTARELTRVVYELTRKVEFSRDVGLCDQNARFMQYLAQQPKSVRDDGIYYDV